MSTSLRRGALAAALSAAGLAATSLAPPAADAASVVSATYELTAEGAYHYAATEAAPGVMRSSRSTDATWRAIAHDVRLDVGTSPETHVVQTDDPATTITGAYHHEGPDIATQDCVQRPDGPASEGLVGSRTDAEGPVRLEVEPFERLDSRLECSTAVPAPDQSLLGSLVTARATVPREDVGAPTIVLHVADQGDVPCPSYELTTSCEASWHGTLTLRRTAVEEAADAPSAPAPPPDDMSAYLTPLLPPAPVVAPAPVPAADDMSQFLVPLTSDASAQAPDHMAPFLVPLVARDAPASLDARTGLVRFHARCAGGCSGTATLRTGSGPRATARAASAGGSPVVRVRVAAGTATREVRVRFPASVRTRLVRGARAELVLRLTDRASGRTARATLPLRRR